MSQEELTLYFTQIGFNLKPSWLTQQLSHTASLDQENLRIHLLTSLVQSNLAETSRPLLPDVDLATLHKCILRGSYILQVIEILNIGEPNEHRHKQTTNRRLKLCLSDGYDFFIAFECSKIPQLTLQLRPGTKIRICDVEIRRGILLLTANNSLIVGENSNMTLRGADDPGEGPEGNTGRVKSEILRQQQVSTATSSSSSSSSNTDNAISSISARELKPFVYLIDIEKQIAYSGTSHKLQQPFLIKGWIKSVLSFGYRHGYDLRVIIEDGSLCIPAMVAPEYVQEMMTFSSKEFAEECEKGNPQAMEAATKMQWNLQNLQGVMEIHLDPSSKKAVLIRTRDVASDSIRALCNKIMKVDNEARAEISIR